MKISQIKEIAKQHQIKPSNLNKQELVRAIQIAEGNQSCFGSNHSESCGQDACVWREDCVLSDSNCRY